MASLQCIYADSIDCKPLVPVTLWLDHATHVTIDHTYPTCVSWCTMMLATYVTVTNAAGAVCLLWCPTNAVDIKTDFLL